MMPSRTAINLTCTFGEATPGDMTIMEAVVAELSLPRDLKSFIKGLLSKDLALSQNVVPITSWTNAELHV